MPFPTDQERERFEAHHGIKWTDIRTLPVSSGTRIHLENKYKRHAATWMAAKAAISANAQAEGFNWTEFWNRVSQNFDSADVDKIYACYKAIPLSAEPAPAAHIASRGEELADRLFTTIKESVFPPEPPAEGDK